MEKILCAAILRKTPIDIPIYYQNDIGKCYLGYRHPDILIAFEGTVSKRLQDQGFFTSKGRYVDRIEAFKIALSAGQILDPLSGQEILYSENLY